MLKGAFYFCLYILCVILFIPIGITFVSSQVFKDTRKEDVNFEQPVIKDIELITQYEEDTYKEDNYNKEKQNYSKNNFEDYIVGVVAAEMPVSFEIEALKAQAIAARTYAYKRINNVNEEVDYKNIGQAYNSIEEMKAKWGNNFDKNYNKINEAVYQTNGMIMTYEDEPIEAVFHSTSAGVTEVSENIWGRSLPYIKSVDSKLDENAPNFIYTTKVKNNQIINKISEKLPDINKDEIIKTFEIKKISEAGYVLEVLVCGKILSGRDIRTMFNLRSTNFKIKKNSDNIEFTTKGYGHGAGMSQYGANFMAQDGKNYIEILNHYYQNIQINNIY